MSDIPDLKKNLILLGTFDANGCKFKAECGVMKIMRGSLLLMKGLKIGTWYQLQGITVTGSVAVSSFMSESNNTKLRHMRVGHMSIRRMEELSKRGLLCGQKIGKLDFM